VRAAESLGFARDAVEGIDNVQWLADASLLEPLLARVAPLLPPRVAGGALRGLNARWRLFRYAPGAVYRPHLDGAWTGSGLDAATGAFVEDAFAGAATSRLTFLIYLNGGFGGGATTFFLPGADEGHVDAFRVEPLAGAVLCFPHGSHEGALVHEGSSVDEGGVKYVIRTDVLYDVVGGARAHEDE
jgi:hypothetical protein